MTSEELTQAVFALCRNVPDLYDIRVETVSNMEMPNFRAVTIVDVTIRYGIFGESKANHSFLPSMAETELRYLSEKLEKITQSPIINELSNASQL